MNILVFNQQQDLPISSESVEPVVQCVLSSEGRSTDEVSIYFVSNEEMCRLHLEFFNDASPTDCISFPMDDEDAPFDFNILGEVFICPKTALEYARKNQGIEPYQETTLYLVHALLHLLGYDDIDEADQKIMREKERELLQKLNASKTLLFS